MPKSLALAGSELVYATRGDVYRLDLTTGHRQLVFHDAKIAASRPIVVSAHGSWVGWDIAALHPGVAQVDDVRNMPPAGTVIHLSRAIAGLSTQGVLLTNATSNNDVAVTTWFRPYSGSAHVLLSARRYDELPQVAGHALAWVNVKTRSRPCTTEGWRARRGEARRGLASRHVVGHWCGCRRVAAQRWRQLAVRGVTAGGGAGTNERRRRSARTAASHRRWRRAWRRWPDAAHDRGGELVLQRGAARRAEAAGTAEELLECAARGRHPRSVRSSPAAQPAKGGGIVTSTPIPPGTRCCSTIVPAAMVAQSLVLAAHVDADQCGNHDQHAGLFQQDADQAADERVAEPDRPAVVADNTQPHDRLADRASSPQRLHQHRIAERDARLRSPAAAREGSPRRFRPFVRITMMSKPDLQQRDDDVVDQRGDSSRPDAGEADVEGDGLAGDDRLIRIHLSSVARHVADSRPIRD